MVTLNSMIGTLINHYNCWWRVVKKIPQTFVQCKFRSQGHIWCCYKKVLCMGVNNKYCAVYSIAQRKHTGPPHYKCFKSWTGSSTSMEADIIATGFWLSDTMHGMQYTQVIGDGDSSVLYTTYTNNSTVLWSRCSQKLWHILMVFIILYC